METSTHIAVVEDDPEISQTMVHAMTEHGFVVTVARSGRDLDRVLSVGKIDLVILDVGLPGEDGLSICRRLRNQSSVPIIMVTARAAETDRIVGLEIGADDYLPKPFSPRELVARVRAVLRRSNASDDMTQQSPKTLAFEGWHLDMARRQLTDPNGEAMPLTSGEFNILAIFCQHPQKLTIPRRAAGPAAWASGGRIRSQHRRADQPPAPQGGTEPEEPDLYQDGPVCGGYFFTPAVSVVEPA